MIKILSTYNVTSSIMKRCSIFFLFSLISLIGICQNSKENKMRIEFKVQESSDPIYPINCNEYGLVITYANTTENIDTMLWTIAHFDVNMEPISSQEIKLKGNLFIRNHSIDGHYLYLALSNTAGKRDKTDIAVIKYDLECKEETKWIGITQDKQVTVNNIVSDDNDVLVTLEDKDKIDYLLYFDFKNSAATTITISTNSSYTKVLNNEKSNYCNGCFNMLILDKTYINNEYSLTVAEVRNKKLRSTNKIMLGDSIMLTSVYPLYSSDNELKSIVGSYFSGNLKKNKTEFGMPATGIFTYNFTDKKVNLLPLKISGSEIYFYWNKPIKADSLIKNNLCTYLFTTELYTPKYNVVSDIDYDYYGRPYSYYREEFEGFKSSYSILYLIDENANIIFSNDLTINGTTHTDTKPKVKTVSIDKNILECYFNFDHIEYRISNLYHKNKKIENLYVYSKYKRDVIQDEYNSKIEKWYNNYYLVYGYQQIKNNSLRGNSRRSVFFAQKVQLR